MSTIIAALKQFGCVPFLSSIIRMALGQPMEGFRAARVKSGEVLGGEGSGVGFWVSSRVVERFQMSSG